jgi:hypothetical protein
VHRQHWGYKVEEKLFLGVREQEKFEYHCSSASQKRERECLHTRIPELTIGNEDHWTYHKEGMTVVAMGEKAACGI